MNDVPAAVGSAHDQTSTDEPLARENAYLRRRNEELQEDLMALGAETERLRQILARIHGRAGARDADSLGGAS